MRTTTDPSACLANFPVSMVIDLPSASSIVLIVAFTIIFLINLLIINYNRGEDLQFKKKKGNTLVLPFNILYLRKFNSLIIAR